MVISTLVLSINLLILLAVLAGGICLQVFLSKRESKWFGLILPFICFACSIAMLLLMFIPPNMTPWGVFSQAAITFLFANIPTIVLLAIYFGCRETIRRKNDIEKMNIQDLE